jgi:hypothetical protein
LVSGDEGGDIDVGFEGIYERAGAIVTAAALSRTAQR